MKLTFILKHQQFDSATFSNDIALITLMQPIQFNQYIQPACLPNPSYGLVYPDQYSNVAAYASGWVTILNFYY